MTSTITTTPVATTGATLPTVLKAIMMFASTDAVRPALTAVRFERNDEGYLRLVATDSYKLGRLDTTIDIGPFEPFAVQTSDLANVIKVMGKSPAYAMVIHERDVEFIGAGSITVRQDDHDFPNVANLWPNEAKLVGSPWAFSPKHMALICKAAQALEPKGAHPVRLLGADESEQMAKGKTVGLKPQIMRVVVVDVGTLDALLMPVRVP